MGIPTIGLFTHINVGTTNGRPQTIIFADKQKSSPIKELLFNQLVKERYKTESVLLDFKSVEVSNTVAVSYNVSISRTLS